MDRTVRPTQFLCQAFLCHLHQLTCPLPRNTNPDKGREYCDVPSRLLAKEQWPYVNQKGFARNGATDDKVSERRSQKFLSFLDHACSEQVEQIEPL